MRQAFRALERPCRNTIIKQNAPVESHSEFSRGMLKEDEMRF
jgi:hypothetical protein